MKSCGAAEKSADRRKEGEGTRDAGAAGKVDLEVISEGLAPIAVLSWKHMCRRRVCAAFLSTFLERCKVRIVSAIDI